MIADIRARSFIVIAAALVVAVLLWASSASAATTIAGPGEGAGQLGTPAGIAVDPTSGVIYVADESNNRIEEFGADGSFLRGFGYGVLDGAAELQVCTSHCLRGSEGPAPGQIHSPKDVAVDPASGDIYVTEKSNLRVQKFSASGQFILMFGKQVDSGPHHPGNVCTAQYLEEGDSCGRASGGEGAGEFTQAEGLKHDLSMPITVDRSGDILVGDVNRIEKFGSSGTYLAEISTPEVGGIVSLAVDRSSSEPFSGDLYVLGQSEDAVQQYSVESGVSFQFTFAGNVTSTLPPSATDAEVQEALEALPSIGRGNVSVFGKSITFTGALGGAEVPGLEVSHGTVATSHHGFSSPLMRLGPVGESLGPVTAAAQPRALATRESGALAVGSALSPYGIVEFGPDGSEVRNYGSGEIADDPTSTYQVVGNDLAFASSGALLVANRETGTLQELPAQVPGPDIVPHSTRVTAIEPTTASFAAVINPENHATSYHFEYLSQGEYEADGESFGAGAQRTPVPDGGLPAAFSYEPVEVQLGPLALAPSTVYRFRLQAEDSEHNVVDGEVESFETRPAIEISGASVTAVGATSAVFEADLNPLDVEAEYRLEYGIGEVLDAQTAPVRLAAGPTSASVTVEVQGLLPDTTYHYRLAAEDERGGKSYSSYSPILTVTTEPTEASAMLPDGRGWEQVSPLEKGGAQILPIEGGSALQAAANGDAITYSAGAPTEAEPNGSGYRSQVLSTRTPHGWTSLDIGLPHVAPTSVQEGGAAEYRLFTPDLSVGLVVPPPDAFTSLGSRSSPPDTEQTPYLRRQGGCESSASACYQPLLTSAEGAADVPTGTEFGGKTKVEGTSGDLRHVVVASSVPLTEPAPPSDRLGEALYEISSSGSADSVQPVSILPSGEAGGETPSSYALGVLGGSSARGAISTDGSRVIFTGSLGGQRLYLRDLVRGETLRLDAPLTGSGNGEPNATFQFANADATKVFFTDRQELTPGSSSGPGGSEDLYECRIVEEGGHLACALSDLTPIHDEERAEVRPVILGASEDGSAVYFVANSVLSEAANARGERAEPGNCKTGEGGATQDCNLYLWREDPEGGGSTITFIAGLAGSDHFDWNLYGISPALAWQTTRSSPDGRYLAFLSSRSLTGYDNRDVVSGKPDVEVYLYDAAAERIICASCDPSGARPHGIKAGMSSKDLVEADNALQGENWFAARIPGWVNTSGNNRGYYQSRYLSNSGRLFFDSSDALVPADTNGNQDVYEYEPVGVGSCEEAGPTFHAADDGCVGLISSGTSARESVFLDASESGNDVFFLASSRLTASDVDDAYDVYDAHVCSSSAPCPPPAGAKPVECQADACQAPSETPAVTTPGSLTYQGPGNLKEPVKKKPVKKRKHKHEKHKHKKHHRRGNHDTGADRGGRR